MHRYRVDPARADIELMINGDAEDLQIAPMLLIPFVENSFKHGLQGGGGPACIRIELNIKAPDLEFRLSNSTGIIDPLNLDKRKGIGIENTKQRLELLYPERHKLDIKKENQTFMVSLKLKLNL
jgi:LytS/YehU family sensor histidine kinase